MAKGRPRRARHALLIVAGMLGLGLATGAAQAQGGCNARGPTDDLKSVCRSFGHDGGQRFYRIYKPAGPLGAILFVLHGAGGSGAAQERIDGGSFARLADRERFLLVFPDGLGRLWNDGRGRTVCNEVDDVGFLTALLAALRREHGLAAVPAYVAGMSNGGMMAFKLACDAADRFSAVAAVVANMSIRLSESCAPSKPIAVAVMNGTADPLIPYNGGAVGIGQLVWSRVLSTAETVSFWSRANGCAAPPVGDTQQTEDGHVLLIEHRARCQGGTEVMLIRVEQGGHTWPGGLQYLPVAAVGPTVRGFDGSAALWGFFRRAGRR
jgi:polyhydroxybutyrate depolymerase